MMGTAPNILDHFRTRVKEASAAERTARAMAAQIRSGER
jgi:hypothetical protein